VAYEPDLPDPKRPAATPQRTEAVRWDVRIALLGLITFYASLHKLFIPLFLKFTRLGDSPYARVDLGLVHALLLFHAISKRRIGHWAGFLIGMGIVMALAEVLRVATGKTVGWLAVSRLLSSLPIGAVCFSAVSTPEFRGNARYALLGAAVGILGDGLIHEL